LCDLGLIEVSGRHIRISNVSNLLKYQSKP